MWDVCTYPYENAAQKDPAVSRAYSGLILQPVGDVVSQLRKEEV